MTSLDSVIELRAAIAREVNALDRGLAWALGRRFMRNPATAFFRTGSTAAGDFALTSEGCIASDVEYMLIVPRLLRPTKQALTEVVDELAKSGKLIPAANIEVSCSTPLGAILRRRSYFYADAIRMGVWLWGMHWRCILRARRLSMHFVNLTLLYRLHDLADVRAQLASAPTPELEYVVAKAVRHLGRMFAYRTGGVGLADRECIKYCRESGDPLGALLVPQLEWARTVYGGVQETGTADDLESRVQHVVGFVDRYLARESLVRERWAVGRASWLERVRDSHRVSRRLLRSLRDPSEEYRRLVLGYVEYLKDMRHDPRQLDGRFRLLLREG